METIICLVVLGMFSMFIFQKQLAQQKQLEEVNSADAIRSLRDSVRSAVSANKGTYAQGLTLLDASEFSTAAYFQGFRVAVNRDGDKLSALIVSPTKLGRYDLDNLSAARISSMLGSSGGFLPLVDGDPSAPASGTLGLWSLDMNSIDASLADPVRIVVQLEFSDSGNEFAEEKDKLLYRTADNGKLSNTMITSLFFSDGSSDTIILDPAAGSVRAKSAEFSGTLSAGGGNFFVDSAGGMITNGRTFAWDHVARGGVYVERAPLTNNWADMKPAVSMTADRTQLYRTDGTNTVTLMNDTGDVHALGFFLGDDFKTRGGLSTTKLVPQAFYADLASGVSIPNPNCPAGWTATVALTPKELDLVGEIDNTPKYTSCECEVVVNQTTSNSYSRSNCPFRINRGGMDTTGYTPCYGNGKFSLANGDINVLKQAPKDWSVYDIKKLDTGVLHYYVPPTCTLDSCRVGFNCSNSWLPIDARQHPQASAAPGRLYFDCHQVKAIHIWYRHKDYPRQDAPIPAFPPQSQCSTQYDQWTGLNPNTYPISVVPPNYAGTALPNITQGQAHYHSCPFAPPNPSSGSQHHLGKFGDVVKPIIYNGMTWSPVSAKYHRVGNRCTAGDDIVDLNKKFGDCYNLAPVTADGTLNVTMADGNPNFWLYEHSGAAIYYMADGVVDINTGNEVLIDPYVDVKAKAYTTGSGPWTVVLEGYKKTDAQVYCKRN
ncbi:hypothetical protein FACS1894186_0860 [Alphaproteobacteria bacterium]|nr:hypothetical protein FACS1894186_0860 [Alphaproteobacteria bacterium]